MDEILRTSVVIVCVVAFIVFIVLLTVSIVRKEGWKKFTTLFISMSFFGYMSVTVTTPGSEGSFSYGPLKILNKMPSKFEEFMGKKKKELEVKNTDTKNTETLILSAESTSPSVSPDLDFLAGKEYVKEIKESEDGREKKYSVTLPPGGELRVASPSAVKFIFDPSGAWGPKSFFLGPEGRVYK